MAANDVQLADYEAATSQTEGDPIIEIERGLGFTDGFQFGCGFWAAGLIAAIAIGLAFLLLAFILSFAGINLLV